MPQHMGRYFLPRQRRHLGRAALDDPVDAEPGERLPAPVKEDRAIGGTAVDQFDQDALDFRPKGALAYLSALSVQGDERVTGARYGMIATVDDAGDIEEFIASGLSDDERRRVAEWPHGYAFFEHLRDLPGALRLADLPGYIRSLGYSGELTLSKTLLARALRHGGVQVGNFFLGEKEDGHAFTDEDEEVLVLFASQAATAIANARNYRDEQRARADLEALVDTSPVGVVVFDAPTGRPVSFNREARRLVGMLRSPDAPPEQLLEVITCRRGDGREIRLGELSLANELRNAETVRGEEIEISVPDGRSVTVLVNATPIRSADGVRALVPAR